MGTSFITSDEDLDKIRMLEASYRGELEELKNCLEKVDVDEVLFKYFIIIIRFSLLFVLKADTDGTTSLQIASAKGHRNLVNQDLVDRSQ